MRDTGLETKDLRFDVMCGLFINRTLTLTPTRALALVLALNLTLALAPTLSLTRARVLTLTRCGLFIKANATNSNAVAEQRMEARKSAESKNEGKSALAGKAGRKQSASSKSIKETEVDQVPRQAL